MKTKYQYLITCLILLACSCIVVTNLTAEKTLTTASWANYYANVNEMKNAADIVIQGTVSSSVSSKYYYPDGSNRYMIVTNHILNVEKLLSGELAENKIIIFQTGGKIGTETSQIVEDPLIVKNTKYILFLRKRSDGAYYIIGGPQGRFINSNNKIYSIGELYPDAALTTKHLHTKGITLEEFSKLATKHN